MPRADWGGTLIGSASSSEDPLDSETVAYAALIHQEFADELAESISELARNNSAVSSDAR